MKAVTRPTALPSTPDLHAASAGQVIALVLLMLAACAAMPEEGRADVPLYFPGHIPVDIARTANRVISLDYDRDGDLDVISGVEEGSIVAVSHFSGGNIAVTERFIVDGGVTAMALLPRPGHGDTLLAVATRNPDRVRLLSYGAGPDNFAVEATVELNEDPVAMVTGEVGPAGEVGLVLAMAGVDMIAVVADVGQGWTVLQELASGDQPTSLALVDFEADGEYEIITADSGVLSHSFTVFRRDLAGSYVLDNQVPGPGNPRTMITFDQDGDDHDELYVTYADSSFISVFTVTPAGLVEDERVTTPLLVDGVEAAFLTAEDLALLGWNTERGVVYYFQRDAGQWSLTEAFYTGGRASHVAVTDLNADTYTDLAVANGSSQTVAMLFGNNLPSFRGYKAEALPSSPVASLVADVDLDGHLDLLVAGGFPPQILDLRGDGYGRLVSQPDAIDLASRPSGLALVFADADTIPDLAVTQAIAGRVSIFRGLLTGGYEVLTEIDLGGAPTTIESSDLDGDGHDDLAVLDPTNDDVVAIFGAGDGTFTDQVPVSFPGDLYALCLTDLDGDDLMDFVVTSSLRGVGNRLNLGGRTFGSMRFLPLDDEPVDLVAIDLDGDEDEDLVVANPLGQYLTLLENLGTGLLQPRVAAHPLGTEPDKLMAADMNLDGHGDIVVSLASRPAVGIVLSFDGWGLSPMINFSSALQPSRPLLGDYNEDSIPDLIVTDIALDLVLTMLNIEPNPVGIESEALTVACRAGDLELTLQCADLESWWLEGEIGAGWVALADQDHRQHGQWFPAPEGWRLVLTGEDLARLSLLPASETLRFRLRAPGLAGRGEVTATAPECLDGDLPGALPWLAVSQPHPNPFNPLVRLGIELRRPGHLVVKVTDLAGRRVATLADGWFPAGSHQVVWNGEARRGPAAAGVYFLQVQSQAGQVVRKAVLLK